MGRPAVTINESVRKWSIRLAASALRHTIDRKIEYAERDIGVLKQEFGWVGIWTAVQTWCDTLHAHATDGDTTRVFTSVNPVDVRTGQDIGADASAPVDWSARLIAARVANDQNEYDRIRCELRDVAEAGPYVAAVLEAVGATIRYLPRGYALMGDANEDH